MTTQHDGTGADPGKAGLFSSTIIPTIGRPSLSRAVESVLAQAGEQIEVIVVNDSGKPLPPATWQQSEMVRIIPTNRRERSVARNTGAAAAKGRFLHFLDDDDWLAPGAFQHLQALSRRSPAKWLYGDSQLVNAQNEGLVRLTHQLKGNCMIQVMAGEWIPLQSSLIDAATFFAVGGFNPLIAGPEDIDLLRRIALVADLDEIREVIAHIVRDELGTSTDYADHPEQSRWAREKILNSTAVFSRMNASANNAYWRGRLMRVYLTSMVWNLKKRRILDAASRAVFSLLSLMVSGYHVFLPDYWRAIVRPYQSFAFRVDKSGLT